tara:strand:- start:18654 stop:18836 length:183 start_codon:yes stop_codon:yes gene_type:complete
MKMRIVSTTDGQHLGFVFQHTANPIKLKGGIEVAVERKIILPNGGIRFVNSNYIIDTVKV